MRPPDVGARRSWKLCEEADRALPGRGSMADTERLDTQNKCHAVGGHPSLPTALVMWPLSGSSMKVNRLSGLRTKAGSLMPNAGRTTPVLWRPLKDTFHVTKERSRSQHAMWLPQPWSK